MAAACQHAFNAEAFRASRLAGAGCR
jgi:hypothetical protein